MIFTPEKPQRLMIDHLLTHEIAYCIVGMGIGKTASCLAAWKELKDRGMSKGVLVLAPLRVANLTWPMEVAQWDQFKKLRVANLRTPIGRGAFIAGIADIYVINYDSIPMLVKLVEKRGGSVPYDTIIYDECFPAGTMVDTPNGPTPIESLKKGDCVLNFTGEDTIIQTYRNEVTRAALIHTDDGRVLVCSASHKFFTNRGWVAAENLDEEGDSILTTAKAMQAMRHHLHTERLWERVYRVLWKAMLWCSQLTSKGSHQTSGQNMRGMWEDFCPIHQEGGEHQEILWDILLGEMEMQGTPYNMGRGAAEKDFRTNLKMVQSCKPIRDCSHQQDCKLETNAERRDTQETKRLFEEEGSQTPNPRWQRETSAAATANHVEHLGNVGAGKVVHRAHSEYEGHPVSPTVANPLQAGHWVPITQDLDRDRRGIPSRSQGQSSRRTQAESTGWHRVVRVEVLQHTDVRLDQYRDANGKLYFYDLGVSRHPSYSVNGMVVHNCTKAKNPKSKRIDMLRKQVPAVPRRWALTGTPAPNSDLDLFPQVRLLDDGERLGRSFHQFKQSWFHPQNPMFEHSKWIINGDDAKARIQQRISDITITLRSSDWLTDVPDAVIEDMEIPMPEATMEAYLEFERELVLELKQSNVQITAANAAALVSKLLQYTSGALYDAERNTHAVHNLKLDALAKLYKAEKSPLLVAVAFRHEQERIRKRFSEARFFEDAKSAEMQKSLLVQWNRGEIPMLVAHPRSIGHGLNLQKGSHRMCWTTLTYSREDYEQFIARLWRRGQTNVVQVHRLMCPGTVDDMVASVLESKQQNERQLLDALIMLESMRDKKPVKLKPKPAPSWEF